MYRCTSKGSSRALFKRVGFTILNIKFATYQAKKTSENCRPGFHTLPPEHDLSINPTNMRGMSLETGFHLIIG